MFPTARGLRQQNALRVCVVAGLALWLLMGNGPLKAAGAATGPMAVDETFESYTRTATTLQPLAQIEAWIGYLRLHPDSPHRANVRMRLQLLAVSLTEEDEAALLDFLAFQQLPRELSALEPSARPAAARSFVARHPRFFGPGAHDEAFVALVTRAGVPDARAMLAQSPGRSNGGVAGSGGNIFATPPPAGSATQDRAGQGSARVGAGQASGEGAGQEHAARESGTQASAARGAGGGSAAQGGSGQGSAAGTSTATAGNTSGATGVASASGSPGSSSTDSPSGVAGATTSSPGLNGTPGPAGSAPSSSSTTSGEASARTGEQAPATLSPTQIAMLPPSGVEGKLEPEERRLHRWIDATADMAPESQQQLWAMYLLLYPESPYAGQARDLMNTATAAVKRKAGTAALSEAEHARIETENRELKQALEKSEAGRRRARRIIGGASVLILILFIIAIA